MEFLTEYILGWSLPALLCLIAGLTLLIIEMFTPGMGVSGILGLVALIAAIVLRADSFASMMVTLALIIVIVFAAGFVVFRSFKKGAISRSAIVLKETINKNSSAISDLDKSELVGLEGECLNTLRPSGNALFGDKKLDVVSEGEFITKGSRVKIERIEGLRIVVKKVEENESM